MSKPIRSRRHESGNLFITMRVAPDDTFRRDGDDIHIDVPAVNYKELRSTSEPESSAQIRARVMKARDLQLRRFASESKQKLYCNAQMASRHIRTFCELSADCERLLERAGHAWRNDLGRKA